MCSRLAKHWVRRAALRVGSYDCKFRGKTGRWPNYRDPRMFGEKLAWMRLYDHNPLYIQLVDKIAVRDYVRERVGEDILIPQYGVWERAEDIDFDSLPDSFVLKCNHESRFVILCPDKSKLDTIYARYQLATRLKMNYYYRHHEWAYRFVKPRIIAEKLLVGDGGGEPMDYKIHCFDGVPHWIWAVKDRHDQQKKIRGNYSTEWERLPFHGRRGLSPESFPRPPELERMLEVAVSLSKGLHYCRVDLYAVEGRVYFGEMTIINGAGLIRYRPDEWNYHWGEKLHLPPRRI